MPVSAPAEALVAAALRALVRQEVEEALRTRQEAGPRPEGYLTTSEVARRAGAAQDTVLAWIGKGLLPATRPQGVKGWRIRPADLEAFLVGQHAGPKPASIDDARRARAAALAAAALGRTK